MREVFFTVRCSDTQPGSHVRVVGSDGALGAWDPAKGLQLHTSPHDFPTWLAQKPVCLGDDPIEYKYVICDGSGEVICWEEDRPNRCLHLGSLVERGVCHRGATRVTSSGTFNCVTDVDDDCVRMGTPKVLVPEERRRRDGGVQLGERPGGSSWATLTRRGGDSSGSFGSSQSRSASVQDDLGSMDNLFAPTVRERNGSRSHMPAVVVPELEHPPRTPDAYELPRRGSSLPALAEAEQPDVGGGPPPQFAPVAPPTVAEALQRVPATRVERDASQPEPGVPERSASQLVREESSSNLSMSSDTSDTAEVKRKPGLPQFEDSYAFVGNGPLGEGTFGLVWRCVPKKKEAGKRVEERAAKIVRKARLQPRDTRLLLGEDGEVMTHMRMQHDHIVTLLEYFDEALTVTLVLEYCRGGDLFDAIVRQSRVASRGMSEVACAVAASHVLSALAYMHGRRVVHRDLKCENVLLSLAGVSFERNIFKLCDFGFAAHDRGEGLCDRLGSPDTVAPEVVIGNRYSFPADLWSTGVLLYMMITAMPPFFAQTDSEVLRRVRNGNYSLQGPIWETVSSLVKNLIRSLMTMDPSRRPTAETAQKHEWFGNLPPQVSRVERKSSVVSARVVSRVSDGGSPTCTSCMSFLTR